MPKPGPNLSCPISKPCSSPTLPLTKKIHTVGLCPTNPDSRREAGKRACVSPAHRCPREEPCTWAGWCAGQGRQRELGLESFYLRGASGDEPGRRMKLGTWVKLCTGSTLWAGEWNSPYGDSPSPACSLVLALRAPQETRVGRNCWGTRSTHPDFVFRCVVRPL